MARLARGDLLRAVGHLSTKITKWTKDCDATLLRVMSYLMSSSRQIGFIGDELRTCSCATTHRCRLCRRPKRPQIDFRRLFGISRHSQLWPLCGQSKKQTAVSHSTVEAELVACNHGLRSEGLPALLWWEPILGRKTSHVLYQDTQATMRILQTGKAPTLTHIRRVHQQSVL